MFSDVGLKGLFLLMYQSPRRDKRDKAKVLAALHRALAVTVTDAECSDMRQDVVSAACSARRLSCRRQHLGCT